MTENQLPGKSRIPEQVVPGKDGYHAPEIDRRPPGENRDQFKATEFVNFINPFGCIQHSFHQGDVPAYRNKKVPESDFQNTPDKLMLLLGSQLPNFPFSYMIRLPAMKFNPIKPVSNSLLSRLQKYPDTGSATLIASFARNVPAIVLILCKTNWKNNSF